MSQCIADFHSPYLCLLPAEVAISRHDLIEIENKLHSATNLEYIWELVFRLGFSKQRCLNGLNEKNPKKSKRIDNIKLFSKYGGLYFILKNVVKFYKEKIVHKCQTCKCEQQKLRICKGCKNA